MENFEGLLKTCDCGLVDTDKPSKIPSASGATAASAPVSGREPRSFNVPIASKSDELRTGLNAFGLDFGDAKIFLSSSVDDAKRTLIGFPSFDSTPGSSSLCSI